MSGIIAAGPTACSATVWTSFFILYLSLLPASRRHRRRHDHGKGNGEEGVCPDMYSLCSRTSSLLNPAASAANSWPDRGLIVDPLNDSNEWWAENKRNQETKAISERKRHDLTVSLITPTKQTRTSCCSHCKWLQDDVKKKIGHCGICFTRQLRNENNDCSSLSCCCWEWFPFLIRYVMTQYELQPTEIRRESWERKGEVVYYYFTPFEKSSLEKSANACRPFPGIIFPGSDNGRSS